MSEVTYEDKSQTGPYVPSKFNAQDANELKAAVNSKADQSALNSLAVLNIAPCVIFIGESNSGGYALNADATAGELAARPSVQILNNVSLEFEDLKIGNPDSNNMLGHDGFAESNIGIVHGWELQLANQVATGLWPSDTVYLIKAGQGGSKLDEWGTDGDYFQSFIERINTAKAFFAAEGKTPLFYIWYSHGINDAIATTDVEVFSSLMLDLWANIRKYTGFTPIALTEIPAAYEAYNTAMRALISDDKFSWMVDTTGLGMRDANHWNYAGMKEIANRMKDVSLSNVGYSLQYILSQNYALSTRAAAAGDGGGSVPVTTLTWSLFQNCSADGVTNALEFTSGSPAGAESAEVVEASSDFEYLIKYNDALGLSGMVVMLEDTSGSTNAWSSSSDPFISGVYCSLGEIKKSTQRNSATLVTAVTQDDVWIRVRKSGSSSVQYDVSEDLGVTWSVNVFTHAGVLAGKSTMYLKAIFAVTGDGAKSVLVERIS